MWSTGDFISRNSKIRHNHHLLSQRVSELTNVTGQKCVYDYKDVNIYFLLAKQHFLAISVTIHLLFDILSSTVFVHSARGYGRKCGLARSAASLPPFLLDCFSTFPGGFGKKIKPLSYQVLLQVICGRAGNAYTTATQLTWRRAKCYQIIKAKILRLL